MHPTGQSSSVSPTPPINPDSEKDVQALFDARPADGTETEEPNFLLRAINRLKIGIDKASAWVGRLVSGEMFRQSPILHIGAPREFKYKPLPEDLRNALAEHDAAKLRKQTTQAFVASVDLPEPESAKPADSDESAFDAYIRLCKRDGQEPGSIACPQNFQDAAVRHATSLVTLVEQRREQALTSGQEFWLPTEDQQRHRAAAGLLALQKESHLKKAGEQALQQEPIQTHSSQQITSFMKWRDAKNDLPKLSADPAFSLDAALAYAGQLLSEHAGKDQAMRDPLKTMLQDASQLIAESDKFKENMSVQQDAADILSLLNELREPSVSPALATGTPPPPPPPRIRKVVIVPEQSPSGVSDLRPPSPPPSRMAMNKPRTLAMANKVPELSTFDGEVQIQASVLLNQFFREYANQQSQGDIRIERNSVYFSAHVVAAAADFLEKVADGAEGDVKPTDARTYAAANYLVRSYGELHRPKT
jgi:hypothetical protein